MKIAALATALVLGVSLMACSGADEETPAAESDEGNFSLRKSEGETCSYNMQCSGELVCRPKAVDSKDLACAKLAQVKESCDEDADCFGSDSTRKSKGKSYCEGGVCKHPGGSAGGH